MSDNEDDVNNDIEILRKNNIQEKNAFLSVFRNDPLFSDIIKDIQKASEEKVNNIPKPVTRKKNGDTLFRFTGHVPNERRSSARLQNKKPLFTHMDLPDERPLASDSDSLEDLEAVVYRVKRPRKSSPRVATPRIIPVEEITDEMISQIQTSGNKVYGPGGTSCHQCRQKTVDTKTVCRSGFCVGIRGQFCGICVINRYGEDPAQALRDPNWQCYVCRGCCNCSFCRLKEGKRPTGILAPLAKTNGFKSVKDFLSSLKGYGDYADPAKDSQNLLGFQHGAAIMGGGQKIQLKCEYDRLLSKEELLKKEQKRLLGFEGGVAVMAGGQRVVLKCDYDEQLKKTYVEI